MIGTTQPKLETSQIQKSPAAKAENTFENGSYSQGISGGVGGMKNSAGESADKGNPCPREDQFVADIALKVQSG